MNNPNYLPKGMAVVTPYFMVKDAPGFLQFLETAFGAVDTFLHRNDAGQIVYARTVIDGCVIECSEAKPEYPAREFACQLFVPDCDATYAKAIAAGATSNGAPADAPYGLRAGYVTDAWGNQWFISTQIAEKYDPKYW